MQESRFQIKYFSKILGHTITVANGRKIMEYTVPESHMHIVNIHAYTSASWFGIKGNVILDQNIPFYMSIIQSASRIINLEQGDVISLWNLSGQKSIIPVPCMIELIYLS